jgi:ElaB/YqjD/DUF883 family membrane-anchored ribosome-binding protein
MDSAHKLTQLLSETEELLGELDKQRGPEIEEIRDRLEKSMAETRDTITRQRGEHVKLRHVAGSFNDYVQHYPWVALATGVLVASTIGILATSATKRSYQQHH